MTAAARLRYRKGMADNMSSAGEPEQASSMPLHIQVRETIRRQVKVGELIDKTGRLMTEAELGKHFGVSRITIRNAIKPLVDEGMFERERGRAQERTNAKGHARSVSRRTAVVDACVCVCDVC